MIDGVRYKSNNETEFKRIVIQNFIKQGDLMPLMESSRSKRKVSNRQESSYRLSKFNAHMTEPMNEQDKGVSRSQPDGIWR